MIDPVRTFQLYLSIKAHFNSEKYDAVAYKGRIKNSSKEDFEKRRDKLLFINFSKLAKSIPEISSIFVANFAYGNDYPLDDIERSLNNYKKWSKVRESLTKTFKDDVELLFEETYNKNIKDYKLHLFNMVINNAVNRETSVIIDSFDPLFDLWDKNFPIWKPEIRRVRKLSSFVKFDVDKFRNIFNQIKEDTEENYHAIL